MEIKCKGLVFTQIDFLYTQQAILLIHVARIIAIIIWYIHNEE